ncbi:30S Ribosomal protein S1 [compost metagenome]
MRNVVDFGAFVDIGVKNDGLVHVSELSDRFVRNPLEVVSVGDVIEVEVMDIDRQRGRVSLSRKRALQATVPRP